MMDSPLANQGQHTITFRMGAKRAKDPANQISVNPSLVRSHEGLQALISAGDWVLKAIRVLVFVINNPHALVKRR